MSTIDSSHPRELLSAYLDDELGHEERASLQRHLEGCGECAALLADWRRLAAASAAGWAVISRVKIETSLRVDSLDSTPGKDRKLRDATLEPSSKLETTLNISEAPAISRA